MKLRNYTPHDFNFYSADGEEILFTLPSECPQGGTVNPPRVSMDTVLSDTITFQGVSVPILTPQLGAVQDLPDPEEGVLLIVSALTKGASNRKDLVSPGEVVRNEKGHIIGARALLTSEERL